MSEALIRLDTAQLTINFKPAAIALKASALATAAMIARVSTPEENAEAVNAQVELKRVESLFEKARVEVTKPLLDAQRSFKATVDKERDELLSELTRISTLVGNYQALQLAKQRAAEAAQRAELEAAERKRQEELAKAKTIEEHAATQEKFNRVAAAITEQPAAPPPVRATGQVVKPEWVIDGINDWTLIKARPDLVRKIEWDRVAIKKELELGHKDKLPGVTAHEEVKSTVRLGRVAPAIEV